MFLQETGQLTNGRIIIDTARFQITCVQLVQRLYPLHAGNRIQPHIAKNFIYINSTLFHVQDLSQTSSQLLLQLWNWHRRRGCRLPLPTASTIFYGRIGNPIAFASKRIGWQANPMRQDGDRRGGQGLPLSGASRRPHAPAIEEQPIHMRSFKPYLRNL